MATSSGYTRLTRNAAGYGSYSSLWLGEDHLMIVRSTGYHETYSRLQLSEVKGIFLTTTKRRLWWTIFWATAAAVSGLVLLVTLTQGAGFIFSVTFAVVTGIGLLWNHALGAGCRAYVLTGVQAAELPALIRINKARKVVARIEPLIKQAQANLTIAPPMPPPNTPTTA